ncbi:MAG: hypothetical protein JJT85_03215 [Chromatiales bacterium]|nr:hypothetical protein [Chromatiales bacterium]
MLELVDAEHEVELQMARDEAGAQARGEDYKSKKALADALDRKGLDWQPSPGEGAYCGPGGE